VNHFVAYGAKRDAVLPDFKGRRVSRLPPAFVVKRDYGIDVPGFKQIIRGIVVACTVREESVDFDIGVQIPKLGQSDNCGHAAVPSRIDKSDKERQIRFGSPVVC
jgi:hypothetical protein